MKFTKPAEIERESMAIIDRELSARGILLPEENRPVVKRVIHATADFDYAETLYFTPEAVRFARAALPGNVIITDTNMALAGISKAALQKLGARALCLMADEDVAQEARLRQVTRATVSMERALQLSGPKLLVCGNAPTFLFPLLEMEKSFEKNFKKVL